MDYDTFKTPHVKEEELHLYTKSHNFINFVNNLSDKITDNKIFYTPIKNKNDNFSNKSNFFDNEKPSLFNNKKILDFKSRLIKVLCPEDSESESKIEKVKKSAQVCYLFSLFI